ncbi:CRISPR-associated endoribonuclease Cas6 [Flammeovirgaceae bacterium SG7u.111]|nr:CRISPR-associated endoribonuclease Cas6 [Flammeovirgaceae bacterium SG7u.132]WPO37490.1 CRISPR-associated endoribonuclease Cas6 [Flammeovirgaceae bacterium SG7u.111]
MRIKIVFELKKNDLIPLDQQYILSLWFQNIFAESSKYCGGKKNFEFYTFSSLNPEGAWKTTHEAIKPFCRFFTLDFSVLIPESCFSELQNMFLGRMLHIGHRASDSLLMGSSYQGAILEVKEFEQEPHPVSSKTIKAISPILVTKEERSRKGKSINRYVAPESDEYQELFFKSMLRRYSKWCSENNSKFTFSNKTLQGMSLKYLGKQPKKVYVSLWEQTPQHERVTAYAYDFEIQTIPEIVDFGLEAGFGEMCQFGFGFCCF